MSEQKPMTGTELAARCRKLDRLYRAAFDARETWLANPTEVNRRRWRYYAVRYARYVKEYHA